MLRLLETHEAREIAILSRAVDPADPDVSVVAWPGRRIASPLQAGDIIVRQPLSGPARSFVLTGEVAENGEVEGEAIDVGATMFGGPTDVRIRLHGPDRILRNDLTVVRVGPPLHEANYVGPPSPPSSRPTIRLGSRGPAVNEAQQRINAIDARRLSRGESRIDRCPLVVDGIFGAHTRGATISFQRLAFLGQANEWDGVIGPRTWAMLDTFSYEQPVDPPVVPVPTPPPPNIVPIIFRPPNPARWGPLLGGLSGAPVRTQNAVRSLIDGPLTYLSMLADLRRANNSRSFIYLLGWDCYDNFPLDASATPPCSTSLHQVLSDAVAAGAQVRAMIWRNITGRDKRRAVNEVAGRINGLRSSAGNGACIVDSRTGGSTPIQPQTVRAILNTTTALLAPLTLLPGINSQVQTLNGELARWIDQAAREMLAAHHQKVLIIFDGEQLVAYCGGIDFNPNRARVTTSCIPRSTPQVIEPTDPQHDTHCRIVGPAARDLLETFVDRWLDHPGHVRIDRDPTRGPLRGAAVNSIPAPPVPNPSIADAPHGGSTSVIIARTFNPVRRSSTQRQRDIRTLLLRAISNAQSFIYMEDQYLWDFDTPSGATLSIATALNRALPNLQHITAVIPGNAISAPASFQRAWRQRFINEVRRGHSREIADRFQVYQLNSGSCTDDGCFGLHTYVHSKCWVFDDELAVIGSANCNRRGYQHDSEVDAFIWDDAAIDPSLVALAAPGDFASEAARLGLTFAQHFRTRLWRGLLGVTVTDGADNSAWPTGSAVVGGVTRFKNGRPLIIGPRADPVAFPIIDGIAESVRPIFDPVSP